MKNKETSKIKASILQMTAQKQLLMEEVKSEINEIANNLKPSNLIKNAASGIMNPSNRLVILKYAAGAVVGFLSRRYLIGKSPGIVRNVTGKAFIWTIRKLIFKI